MRVGDLEIVDPWLLQEVEAAQSGEMEHPELVDLLNRLIAYGLVWRMGPRWRGVAYDYIRQGYCSLPCNGRC